MFLTGADLVLNRTGDIIHVAERIKEVAGYEERELIGKKGFGVLFASVHYDLIVAQRNLRVSVITSLRRKDGGLIRVGITIRNLLHIEHINGVIINLYPIS